MAEIKDLDFLPLRSECNETNWREKIEKKRQSNKLRETEEQILNLILNKEDWTLGKYKSFRTNLTKINGRNRKYAADSILKTLGMDEEKIRIDLFNFALVENQDYYPFKSRKKDKNTGKYYYEEKKMEIDDCFCLIVEVTKKLDSYFASLTNEILQELNNDVYFFLDIIVEMAKNKEDSLKLEVIKRYDEKFGYLKDIEMLEPLYNNYKDKIEFIILHFISTNISRKFNVEPFIYVKTRLEKN